MQRPEPDEYAPYYALYIDQVPEGDVLDLLGSELKTTLDLLKSIPEEEAATSYAEGKWSIKDLVGHMIDAERTFGYRALWFAREAPGELPSMDQDQVASSSNAAERTLESLADEFEAVRVSHIYLFAGMTEAMALRRGRASGCEFSVRSLPYILVGHEIHHRKVLEERYLG